VLHGLDFAAEFAVIVVAALLITLGDLL